MYYIHIHTHIYTIFVFFLFFLIWELKPQLTAADVIMNVISRFYCHLLKSVNIFISLIVWILYL